MEKLKEEIVKAINSMAAASAYISEAYKDIPDPPDIHDQMMADLLSGTGDIIVTEMGKLANSIGKAYAKQLLDEYKDFATIKATSSKAIAKKIEGINEKLADKLKEAI